mgnify:CR=1 FL=1
MAGLDEFFAMGGYAAYVWPAYGIVALVLIGLFAAGRRFQRTTETELAGLRPAGRRRGTEPGADGDEA